MQTEAAENRVQVQQRRHTLAVLTALPSSGCFHSVSLKCAHVKPSMTTCNCNVGAVHFTGQSAANSLRSHG